MSDKIGRNDKCPYGSQLKYKKCCLESKLFEPEIVNSSDDNTIEEYDLMDELLYNIFLNNEDNWDEIILIND